MSKRILFGGLLAVGILSLSAGSASAQFVTPYVGPGAYGSVYPTPNGGIVQKQYYSTPFGGTYYNRSYANPYYGVASNYQGYAPGYFGGFPTYRQSYVSPFGYNSYYGYGNGIGVNLNFGRPGANLNFGYYGRFR